jgi:hypothetical protein
MEITFETEKFDNEVCYRASIKNGGEIISCGPSGQFYPTQGAAILAVAIKMETAKKDSEPNFLRHATRMTLKMIGSNSAY